MRDLPNNSSTPAVFQVGGSYVGDLETSADRDWIGIDLVAGQTVEITLEGQFGSSLDDTVLGLYSPQGTLITSNDDYQGSLSSGLIYTPNQTGRFFVEASSYASSQSGRYVVQAQAVTPPTPLESIDWGTQVDGTVINVYFAGNGETFDGYTSEGFNAYEIGRFMDAFARIEAVTQLQFNVVMSPVNADFRLVLDTNEINGEFLGYFNPPGEFNAGVGVFDGGSGWDRSAGGNLEVGGFGFVTITHEILHGLGFAHPHDNGGTSAVMAGVEGEFEDYGDFNLNQGIFTTMSYNSGYFTGTRGSQPAFSGDYGYEAGPMAFDIALLQEKYGANTTTNAGNTVYRLDATNDDGTHWQAIWDAGGIDEIRSSGTGDALIDLRVANFRNEAGSGGFVSSMEGIAGGFTIAGGTLIENATGGAGNDTIFGNFADNVIRGGAGADTLIGGLGNDFYFVDNTNDQVVGEIGFSRGGGVDTIRSFVDYTQPDNVEILRLGVKTGTGDLQGIGNDAPGIIVGNAGENVLIGRGGNDQLNGNDGDDTIIGNSGQDSLVGGFGRDTFVFETYADSRAGRETRDFVNGFAHGGDRIDLSALDANTRTFGTDDAFTFIGTAAFGGRGAQDAGQLRTLTLAGQNAVIVEADHNGDGAADLQIFVNGTYWMTGTDFIL